MHRLIHEVNHSLHLFVKRENDVYNFMGNYKSNRVITSIGFSDKSDDYVYEIINDYMTRDLLKIAVNNLPNNDAMLDFNFDSLYYGYLDKIANFYVYKMYMKDKEKLKKVLIEAHGSSYYEQFGSGKWDYISNKFKEISSSMDVLIAKYLSSPMSDYEIIRKCINDLSIQYKDFDSIPESEFDIDVLFDEIFHSDDVNSGFKK